MKTHHERNARATLRVALLAAAVAMLALWPGCSASDASIGNPGAGRVSVTLESSNPAYVGDPVRLRAVVSQTSAAAYRWSVKLAGASVTVDTEGDGSRATFTPAQPGTYLARCEVDTVLGGYPIFDEAKIYVDSRSAAQRIYTLQVVPPARIGAPVTESELRVGDGDRSGLAITVADGVSVALVVQDGAGAALPAFVSLWSSGSQPLLADTYLVGGEGKLRVSGTFDMLVVPESDAAAPKLLAGLRAADLTRGLTVKLDGGVALRGAVFAERTPLAGATVSVRVKPSSGAVEQPSTLGTVGADGRFTVRARAGRARVTIVPPASSSLPLAHVGDFDLGGGKDSGWTFRYNALARARFDAVVLRSDNKTPAAGARVVVRTNNIAAVGELHTASGVYKASGEVRLELTTDAAGRVVSADGGARALELVPGKYVVEVAPGKDAPSSEGRALVPLEVTASASAPYALALARRVSLRGTVRSADVGPVRALVVARSGDQQFTARSTADGRFDLAVDDNRLYNIVVRPLQQLTKGALGPKIYSNVKINGAYTLDVALPIAVNITGHVQTEGGAKIADAVVRVVCASASCGAAQGVVDETRTSADGSFALRVPRP